MLPLTLLFFSQGPFSREAENGVLLAFVESKYPVDQLAGWFGSFFFLGGGGAFVFLH